LRFIDLSVAGVISITAVALLLAWNPQAPDIAARRNMDQASLRDLLTAVAQRIGVAQIIQDSPRELCSSLGSLSNSTVTYSAEVGGLTCDVAPTGAALAELTFAVGSKVVVLESWYGEGQ
jgi:hypothetical protein